MKMLTVFVSVFFVGAVSCTGVVPTSPKQPIKTQPLKFQFLIFRGDRGKRSVILCDYHQIRKPKVRETVLLRDGDKRLKREKITNAGYTHDGKYILVESYDSKSDDLEANLWSFRTDTGQLVPIEKALIEEGDYHGGYQRRNFLLPDRRSIVANRGGSSLHLLEHGELIGQLEVTRFDLLNGSREKLTTGFLVSARPFPHQQPKLTGKVYYQPVEGQFIGYVDLAGEQVNEIAYRISLPQSMVSFRLNRDKTDLLVCSSTRIGRRLVWTMFRYQIDDGKLVQSKPWQNVGYGRGVWSQDGRYALCENKWPSDDPVAMVIFSPQGVQLARFTLPANFHPTDWFGETIIGSYNHGNGSRLATINVQFGVLSSFPPKKAWKPYWLAGGKSVLALVTTTQDTLTQFNTSSWATERRLWHSVSDFTISPDGSWVAFVTGHCPGLFIDNLEKPGQLIQVSNQADGSVQWLEK